MLNINLLYPYMILIDLKKAKTFKVSMAPGFCCQIAYIFSKMQINVSNLDKKDLIWGVFLIAQH